MRHSFFVFLNTLKDKQPETILADNLKKMEKKKELPSKRRSEDELRSIDSSKKHRSCEKPDSSRESALTRPTRKIEEESSKQHKKDGRDQISMFSIDEGTQQEGTAEAEDGVNKTRRSGSIQNQAVTIMLTGKSKHSALLKETAEGEEHFADDVAAEGQTISEFDVDAEGQTDSEFDVDAEGETDLESDVDAEGEDDDSDYGYCVNVPVDRAQERCGQGAGL